MTKYSSIVKIEFAGNIFEAESKEEYIRKVMESFKDEHCIDLDESEIHDIEEEEEHE